MPYIKFYFNPEEDYLCKLSLGLFIFVLDPPANPHHLKDRVCRVALWCVFETGIGIVAGCLPPLRKLVKRWINFDSTHDNSSGATPYGSANALGVTSKIGAGSRSQRFHKTRNATKGDGSEVDGTWERLEDDSSKRRIFVTVDVEMSAMERAAPSTGSHDSIEELARQHRI